MLYCAVKFLSVIEALRLILESVSHSISAIGASKLCVHYVDDLLPYALLILPCSYLGGYGSVSFYTTKHGHFHDNLLPYKVCVLFMKTVW